MSNPITTVVYPPPAAPAASVPYSPSRELLALFNATIQARDAYYRAAREVAREALTESGNNTVSSESYGHYLELQARSYDLASKYENFRLQEQQAHEAAVALKTGYVAAATELARRFFDGRADLRKSVEKITRVFEAFAAGEQNEFSDVLNLPE